MFYVSNHSVIQETFLGKSELVLEGEEVYHLQRYLFKNILHPCLILLRTTIWSVQIQEQYNKQWTYQLFEFRFLYVTDTFFWRI